MIPAPVKPTVPFSAFEALDIRVGMIERIEDVSTSAKLLRLTVNFGSSFKPKPAASKPSTRANSPRSTN